VEYSDLVWSSLNFHHFYLVVGEVVQLVCGVVPVDLEGVYHHRQGQVLVWFLAAWVIIDLISALKT
jgi:hypothetical protein